MKNLLTLLFMVPVFWMSTVLPAEANKGDVHYDQLIEADPGGGAGLDPVIVAASWKGSRNYGYYDRWDHRNRGHSYFDRHRHGYDNPRFYGHRHDHSYLRPLPFHRNGYHQRPYRGGHGGHFGLSVCYRSGSVSICINESQPYRYRYR